MINISSDSEFLEGLEKAKKKTVNREIFTRVRIALVNALDIDESDVKPNSRLVRDLEYDDIDELNVLLSINREFNGTGLDMTKKSPFARDIILNPKYSDEIEPERFFTNALYHFNEKGIKKLQKRVPSIDVEEIQNNPNIRCFDNVLRVKDLCYVAQQRLRKLVKRK